MLLFCERSNSVKPVLLKLRVVSLLRLTSGTDVTVFPLKFKSVRFTNSSNPVKSVICLSLKSN